MGVVCCQVEVFASGWSLVQRSPTECDVSECDREAWVINRSLVHYGCCVMEKNFQKGGHIGRPFTTLK